MSTDAQGGIDYASLKRHYDADDYAAIPFTVAEDYYVVGLMAYFSDATVIDIERGWGICAHGQTNYPTWAAALGLVGAAPTEFSSFEAKDILFLATQDCLVRFEGSARVQHFIPANTPMHFHRRCNILFVVRSTADGVLQCWLEG